MRRSQRTSHRFKLVAVVAASALIASACSSTKPPGDAHPSGAASSAAAGGTSQGKFFNQAELDRQLRLRSVAAPGGPAAMWSELHSRREVVWRRYAETERSWDLCFSNAVRSSATTATPDSS